MKLAISLKFQVVILKVTIIAIQVKNKKKKYVCTDGTQVAVVLAVSCEITLIIYNRFLDRMAQMKIPIKYTFYWLHDGKTSGRTFT